MPKIGAPAAMIAEGRPWAAIRDKITIEGATTTAVGMVTKAGKATAAGTVTTAGKVTEVGKATGAGDRWMEGMVLIVALIARALAAGIEAKGSPRNTASVST